MSSIALSPLAVEALNEAWREDFAPARSEVLTVQEQCLRSHAQIRGLAFERPSAEDERFEFCAHQVDLGSEPLQLVA